MSDPIITKPSVELGINYKERKDDPPLGMRWYKVQNEDSFYSIAAKYGLTWMDLCLMNFRTIDGAELNWYLKNYVGCKNSKDKWYYFTGADDPGMILVPDFDGEEQADDEESDEPVIIDLSLGNTSTLNTSLPVEVTVVERKHNGKIIPISGKWLYVFSGPGLNFGCNGSGGNNDPDFAPPEILGNNISQPGADGFHEFKDEILVLNDSDLFPEIKYDESDDYFSYQDNFDFNTPLQSVNDDYKSKILPPMEPDDKKRGSAFGAFPNQTFWPCNKPDRLDYEIYISPEKAPSRDHLEFIGGPGFKNSLNGQDIRYDNSWYFLSDQRILSTAGRVSRKYRTQHTFLNRKVIKLPGIEVDDEGHVHEYRRYYFFLSPVQLGPNALRYIVSHPEALSPLIDLVYQANMQQNFQMPYILNYWYGPNLLDYKTIKIAVSDPYSWAEDIAEEKISDSFAQYVQWMQKDKDEALEAVKSETKWDSEKYELATYVKAIRDNYKDPDDIDSELKNKEEFYKKLKTWDEKFIDRNARYLANLNADINELYQWLIMPAHRTIDIALMYDTYENLPIDFIDIARGIIHYCDCLEYNYITPAGQLMIKDLFDNKNGFLWKYVWDNFHNLGKEEAKVVAEQKLLCVYKYAAPSLLQLIGMRLLIDQNVPDNMTSEQYIKNQMEQLAGVFNGLNLLPATMVFNKNEKEFDFGAFSTSLLGLLDFTDKAATYIIDPAINIQRNGNIFKAMAASFEEWLAANPRRQARATVFMKSASYSLKAASGVLNVINVILTINKARFDYQHQVSIVDWASAVSGMVVAIQDILAEVAVLTGSSMMQRWFPQLFTTTGPAAWNVVKFSGFGKAFGVVNAIALVVMAACITYSMYKGWADARAVGDTSATIAYGVGVLGGLTMCVGAVIVGYAIIKAGVIGIMSVEGAPIGILLLIIGGVVVGVCALIAWLTRDNSFEIFTRKCFFGKDGQMEPRFPKGPLGGGGPPGWTLAKESGTDTWPVKIQKKALFNLLGKFNLKTELLSELDDSNNKYNGRISFTVNFGYVPDQFEIDLEVYYEDTSVPKKGKATFIPNTKTVTLIQPSELCTNPQYGTMMYGKKIEMISALVTMNADYSGGKEVVATVTLRFPEIGNIIKCKRLVFKDKWTDDHYDKEIESDIFE